MLVTVVTAAADEIHQTFIPSRTGAWQDVVLDTCGAAVLQVIIYFLSLRAFNRCRPCRTARFFVHAIGICRAIAVSHLVYRVEHRFSGAVRFGEEIG